MQIFNLYYLFSATLNLISVYHVICEKNKRNTQNSVSEKHYYSTLIQIIQIDKKVESRKSYFYVVCIYNLCRTARNIWMYGH